MEHLNYYETMTVYYDRMATVCYFHVNVVRDSKKWTLIMEYWYILWTEKSNPTLLNLDIGNT